MPDWSAGYVTEVNYVPGFYRELVPSFLSLAALLRGAVAPGDGASPIRYCELGSGYGLTAAIVAAANPQASVVACDFNPAQTAAATELAAAGRLGNVHFIDQDFERFAADAGHGTFDIIALHGIYTWIDAPNRARIVRILAEKLRPGGLAYVSYNAMPGWAAAAPLQRLLSDYTAAQPAGPILARFDRALDAVRGLQAANARYFTQNPALAARLDGFAKQSRSYLVHEYLNRSWTPMYCTDVAAELAAAKLTYLGSAHLLDHLDAINFTPDQQELLRGIADAGLRELTRDVLVNQQFRRDIFIKGAVPAGKAAARDKLLATRFALSADPARIDRKIAGPAGEVELQAAVYDPVLQAFAAGPRTLGEAAASPEVAALGWPRLLQAVSVLVGMGCLQPALPEAGEANRRASADALNRAIILRAREAGDLGVLASPVTGGGVAVDRLGQLALLAGQVGVSDIPGWIWSLFRDRDQRLVRDGKPIESAEDNVAELRRLVGAFETGQRPILAQLGIA